MGCCFCFCHHWGIVAVFVTTTCFCCLCCHQLVGATAWLLLFQNNKYAFVTIGCCFCFCHHWWIVAAFVSTICFCCLCCCQLIGATSWLVLSRITVLFMSLLHYDCVLLLSPLNVDLLSPWVAVAVFVTATVSWLLTYLSPSITAAAFVMTGWLVPPIVA